MMAEPDKFFRLARAYENSGRLAEAQATYLELLAVQPTHAGALRRLGTMALRADDPASAVAFFRRAVAAEPSTAQHHHRLARALQALRRIDEALAALTLAVRLDPEFTEAHLHLGRLLYERRQFDRSAEILAVAVRQQPDSAEAHAALAQPLKQLGQWDDALDHLRRAVALAPTETAPHSDLIASLHYQSTADTATVRVEQAAWNRRHAAPLAGHFSTPYENTPAPSRRLRIGYVSANFCQHAETAFVLPLLEAHDWAEVEVHCYASVQKPDAVTARLQRTKVIWHNVVALSDAELAEKIRVDRIDILIDLLLHYDGSRMLTFARRPAPLQVSWASFIDDAGLDFFDYRLSDALVDPPEHESIGTVSHVVRLPGACGCFQPLGEYPDVGPLPAVQSGRVTFGALNNFLKINDPVLHCWARVLTAMPESRLLFACPDGSARRRVLQTLVTLGIVASRIDFVGQQPLAVYRRLYREIDVALDPFPYNGCTTTCDALWMGVPVITLTGRTVAGRMGLSLLTHAGLAGCVALDETDYVRIAAEMARDLPRIAALRFTMRTRLKASRLMDAPRFARDVETAYRTMWHRWCEP